ncbi:hypothetical protein BDV24DRAFT_154840 [Aspergillus arachidicola]|uniref:Cyanovirin-N domain-containing protein n=1 Tax=Aspergillus arachidicola TaxID=656916 RepID=A0A5N6XUQ7_9EURO|nr:hypothetical protein BDV24DRAFT_154840 [Aspergillus arachidicola]
MMYRTLILLATYLAALAASQTITPENTLTNPVPGAVLPRSGFQILPKRAPPKKTPPKQLLTASCNIPGTNKKQYSELSLDRCLGWHKNDDGSGRLLAQKHGGGLSKAGGECSTCRYLNSNPNMLCYCAKVRDNEKTYMNPATATWTGHVFYNLCKCSVSHIWTVF